MSCPYIFKNECLGPFQQFCYKPNFSTHKAKKKKKKKKNQGLPEKHLAKR